MLRLEIKLRNKIVSINKEESCFVLTMIAFWSLTCFHSQLFLLHIGVLTCHAGTHTPVLSMPLTWTFVTKHEGGSDRVFVLWTNENSILRDHGSFPAFLAPESSLTHTPQTHNEFTWIAPAAAIVSTPRTKWKTHSYLSSSHNHTKDVYFVLKRQNLRTI